MEQFNQWQESTKKVMDELIIRAKGIKLLPSTSAVSKSVGPVDIHPKILKYSSNESFINTMS